MDQSGTNTDQAGNLGNRIVIVPNPVEQTEKAVRKRRLIERTQRVSELSTRGFTNLQIAMQLDLTVGQVRTALRYAERFWRESAVSNVQLLKSREIRKLAEIEKAAWLGWDRSLKDAVVRTKEDGEKSKTTKRVEAQSGNARFLTVILDCIEKRCRILGLYEEEKTTVVDLSLRMSSDIARGILDDQGYVEYVHAQLRSRTERRPDLQPAIDTVATPSGSGPNGPLQTATGAGAERP